MSTRVNAARIREIEDTIDDRLDTHDQTHAGHADPRTTRLYDRRHKRVTRNIVEHVSI